MNGAVITALNEQATIGPLVEALRAQGLAVCVVDDGSTDRTGELAHKAGAHVIHNWPSKGIGRSLLSAWRYALSVGWEYTIQIDAGGSHVPEQWYRLFAGMGDNGICVGSRFMELSRYIGGSWWRKLGSRITAAALNFATHQRITDWTSGYRCFSRRALQALVDVPYLTNMHTWQIEVLHAALMKGLTVAEAPITYRAGRSTFSWRLLDDLIRVYLQVFFAVPR